MNIVEKEKTITELLRKRCSVEELEKAFENGAKICKNHPDGVTYEALLYNNEMEIFKVLFKNGAKVGSLVMCGGLRRGISKELLEMFFYNGGGVNEKRLKDNAVQEVVENMAKKRLALLDYKNVSEEVINDVLMPYMNELHPSLENAIRRKMAEIEMRKSEEGMALNENPKPTKRSRER